MQQESLKHPQETTLGDMDIETFRKYGHEMIDWIAEYIENIEKYPVLSQVKPGEIKNKLPKVAPYEGESMEKIFKDFEAEIMPGITHWNSPNFLAYFSVSGSLPGVLGELLCAALNQQGMLWKTSPVCTELEEVVLSWLRDLLKLDSNFFGIIYDTASTSTLHALCAAREALNLKIREEGMAGRKDLLPLRLYTSEEAHSSVEKAAIAVGIGQKGVKKVASDGALQMDIRALEKLIEEDIKEGCIPFCTVATVGTTSTTSIDPVALISEICKKYKMWLHVDAAYGGAAAIVPEMILVRDGWNLADSIVLNPHKWLFSPMDLSVLYCKKPDILKRAFSLVPEYLKTHENETNLMDYSLPLGRRFRALKLWFIMKYFGKEGLINRIREHIKIARDLKSEIDKSVDFHCLSVPFSVLCFRFYPKDLKDKATSKYKEEIIDKYLDEVNKQIMDTVNSSGKIFISHTKVQNRLTLRLAIGNIRTTKKHIKDAWKLIQEEARKIDKKMRADLKL